VNASEKCEGCPYLVDWEDFPETTGYSMYKGCQQSLEAGIKLKVISPRFGCMRLVAKINQKNLEPCKIAVIQPRQLVMELG
jgi:hypothetical protein